VCVCVCWIERELCEIWRRGAAAGADAAANATAVISPLSGPQLFTTARYNSAVLYDDVRLVFVWAPALSRAWTAEMRAKTTRTR